MARFNGTAGNDSRDAFTVGEQGQANLYDGLAGNDTLGGGDLNDTILGGDGDDQLSGRGGVDTFFTGSGTDAVAGGAGSDFCMVGPSSVITFNGGEGIDRIDYTGELAAVRVNLSTGLGYGAAAGDRLISVESLIGSQFADNFVGAAGGDRIDGGNGADAISGRAGNDTLVSGDGQDTLRGEDGDDRLGGGSFADSGDDLLIGGAGNDFLDDQRGQNTLQGGEGNDGFSAFSFRGSFYGEAGDDTISGIGGNDSVQGGEDGPLLIDGGDGIDTVNTYSESEYGGVTINLATGVVINGRGDVGTIRNVEVLRAEVGGSNKFYGSAANETMVGGVENGGGDTLSGGDGDDVILSSGFSFLDGGAGNDTIDNQGFSGAGDTLRGGAGADVIGNGLISKAIISYSGASVGLKIDLGPANPNSSETNVTVTGGGDAAGDVIRGQYIGAVGSEAADTITSNEGSNRINGGGGNDNISTGGGRDTIYGGSGADTMAGGVDNDFYTVTDAGDRVIEANVAGADTVNASVSYSIANQYVEVLTLTGSAAINATGNGLANVLTGNRANNTLTGGAGADTFVFNTALNGTSNVDAITDFVVAYDKMRLDDAVFAGLARGTLAAGAFHTGAGAHDADDRVIYNRTTGDLFFDVNGNGAGGQVKFATLDPGLALSNTDFVVV